MAQVPPSSSSDDFDAGGQNAFGTTHWSVVLRAGGEDSSVALAALEELCRGYWYPLYAFCRRKGYRPEDAEDLTQQFFAVFLAKNSFAAADPERGRFRNFLLASFRHFLVNEHHRMHTQKRGGEFAFVAWDELEAEAQYRNEPDAGGTAEGLFDQAWAHTLLANVLRAMRAEHVANGRGGVFDALQVFLTAPGVEKGYAEIGASLQMSEAAVKMAVSRLRSRYGQKLREEIARTVLEPAAVEEELRHLAGVLSH